MDILGLSPASANPAELSTSLYNAFSFDGCPGYIAINSKPRKNYLDIELDYRI